MSAPSNEDSVGAAQAIQNLSPPSQGPMDKTVHGQAGQNARSQRQKKRPQADIIRGNQLRYNHIIRKTIPKLMH